jgi:hypothetical protein
VPHERVHDAVEPGSRLGVGEHDGGQRRPVQGAVGRQHLGPERLDDGGQAGAPRLHHLAGDAVGVDDDGAPRGQQGRHGALPRADPARQSDPQHVRTVAIQPKKVTEG